MPTPSFISAPHEEAVALLRGKKPVASSVFYKLMPELRARAFTVSGLAGATVLQRVRDAVAAVPQGPDGMTWDQAKREIADELEAAHFSEEAAEARANLILRVNTFQAYSASIYRVAMEDDDTTHLQYMHGDQAKDPTPEHEALDGIVLPKNDPFWQTHTGPWGHLGCVCYVRPMNPDLVDEERAMDADRAPENRNVLEGPVREHLNQGEIIRNGRRFNVSPPDDPMAFRWHPDDLRIPIAQIQERYDPEVWRGSEEWARNTGLGGTFGRKTVWTWLMRKETTGSSDPYLSAIDPGSQRPPKIQSDAVGTDYQLAGMSGKARAKVIAAEKELLKLSHERCLIFDKQGNVVGSFDGGREGVPISPGKRHLLRGGVVSHNQPDGGTFSPKDVFTGCIYQVAELRLITNENVFSLRPGRRKLDLHNLENIRRAVNRLAPKGLTMENGHRVWKTVAAENGLNYIVT